MDGGTERNPRVLRGAAGGRRRGAQSGEDRRRVPLDEPLLDCTAAAALLGVRVSWMRDAARLGQVPCLRLGRHIRFSRLALEAWLAEQEAVVCAAPSGALGAARRNHGGRGAAARARREREVLIAGLERPARVGGEGRDV